MLVQELEIAGGDSLLDGCYNLPEVALHGAQHLELDVTVLLHDGELTELDFWMMGRDAADGALEHLAQLAQLHACLALALACQAAKGMAVAVGDGKRQLVVARLLVVVAVETAILHVTARFPSAARRSRPR